MDRCLFCYYYDRYSETCTYSHFDDPYDPNEVQPACCQDDPYLDQDPYVDLPI